ncbi:hypothetical protein SCA03_08750 [Streptomyces cacaoi]|uniref:Uncharacterized protein n=1 Tax=Streptomyces cacaoi TaxID=1898 RepID=A0A4Y3QSD9_STRCI|nr:hypothetical protein SCA03_08750 [Streptomyces cacaoi]
MHRPYVARAGRAPHRRPGAGGRAETVGARPVRRVLTGSEKVKLATPTGTGPLA